MFRISWTEISIISVAHYRILLVTGCKLSSVSVKRACNIGKGAF